MSLSKQYLSLNESTINEELPLKLQTALERLEKKATGQKAELATALLNKLIQEVAQTPAGMKILKDIASAAYEQIVRGEESEKDYSEFIEYFRSFYDPKHKEVIHPEMIGSGWTDKDILDGIKKRGSQFEGDTFDREAIRDMLIAKFGEGEKKVSTPKDMKKEIEDWLEKAKKATEEHYRKTMNGKEELMKTLGWKKGPKFYSVYVENFIPDGGKSAFCFIDMEGNIYKAAAWGKVAKGVRTNISKVPAEKITGDTGFLYRYR